MKFLRFLPMALLAMTAPLLGGLDACVGVCDFETDANCPDPARAQVSGTLSVPQAGGAALGLQRITGPLARDVKHAMAEALVKRGPRKVQVPRQSKNNVVPSSKTAEEHFRAGEIIFKAKEPVRERKAEIGRAIELYLGDKIAGGVTVEVRNCGTAYRCLAVVRTRDGKLLELADTADATTVLSGAPFLAYAEKNLILQMLVQPNDEFFTLQWHYAAIDLPTAWDVTLGEGSIVAAVIDTGVLLAHPDLQDRVTNHSADLIDDPTTANDGDGRDDDGDDAGDNCCGDGVHSHHGSHVAGTMGADTDNGLMTSGITWEGQILPVRVLGAGGGSLSDIADGVEWAIGNPVEGVSDNPTPADVINMSLGGTGESEALNEAIADAVATGCIVIVAAGNDNTDATEFTPANAPDSITVAAHGNTGPDRGTPRRASYSNFGGRVDVAGPGGEQAEDVDNDGQGDGVLSTVDDFVTFYQGTSMASPHVAGIAMLMKSLDVNLTQEDVRDILVSTANPDLDCPEGCGAGRVSAAAAVFGIGGGLDGPKVIASPAFVRVGLGQTSTTVVFKNIGNAASDVTISVGGADRDRCAASSAGGNVGPNENLALTVELARNAAADDRGECTITATFSEGASEARVVWTPDAVVVPTTVEIGAVLIEGDAFRVARIVVTSAVQEYQYKLFNLDPGTYLIVGLIDQNNDGDYDDDEDGVGIYVPPDVGDAEACTQAECGRITVVAGDDVSGADFVVAPGFSGDDGEQGGTGNAGLGDACTASSECAGGLYCEFTLLDGYCTTDCIRDSDCAAGGLCFSLEGVSGEVYEVCLKPCTVDADCNRTGYSCDGDGTCFPN